MDPNLEATKTLKDQRAAGAGKYVSLSKKKLFEFIKKRIEYIMNTGAQIAYEPNVSAPRVSRAILDAGEAQITEIERVLDQYDISLKRR